MKKQTAGDSKVKQATPTKRKWNSKVADVLAKTFDRHEATRNEDLGPNIHLNFEVVDSLLSKSAELVELDEIDQLVEEAGVLGIPAHNDNLKKLEELKKMSTDFENEAQEIGQKKTEHKLSKYINLLSRLVNAGLSISHLQTVNTFIKRNLPLIEAFSADATLQTLTQKLQEAEKHAKNYDPELIDLASKRKDKYRKAISKAEEILKTPQLCQVNEKSLRKLVEESHEQGFEFPEKERIRALSELIRQIRDLARRVFGRESDTIENELAEARSDDEEDLSDVVQHSTFRLKDMLEEDISADTVTILETRASNIKTQLQSVKVDDPEILNFLSKLDSVVWRYRAKEILDKGDENEEELVKLLQDTPKDIVTEGCREYSQIKERVHAIQAAQSNEKRITEKLEHYWDDENIHNKLSEIRSFVEETKSFILNKKLERKLEVLEQVALALKNSASASNKEDLVDEMSDLKLQDTKVFQKLSAISKSSEKAEKQVGWIRQNKKKLQKYRETSVSPNVRLLLEMPKMKISQAREILHFLKGLPANLKAEYDSDIKELDSEVNSLGIVSQEAESLLKQYSRQKFLEMKYTPAEVRSCIDKLRQIVMKLYDSNYRDESLEGKLNELDLLVKSACLLDRSIDSTIKRDISSWESTLKALKEWSKDDSRNSLMKAILQKMKKAEKIMMDVHRMRQYDSQFALANNKTATSKIITRQNRMPSVDEAKALLASYEDGCTEIELEDTSTYLKNLIESCEERTNQASSPNTQISDLVIILEHLKKTPLNLESFTQELSDKINKSQEFIKRVKNMSTETLVAEMNSLREEYTKLGARIPDFEKLSEQFSNEKEKCQHIEHRADKMGLSELMRVRQSLISHSFYRDRSLEAKLLNRQIQLLEDEFNRPHHGYDDEMDNPIIDLVSLETLQKELMEVRKHSRANFGNKGQFLAKLISDIKTYLQENIYSLDLIGVSRLKSYCFKRLVDLNKEITDHKIKLEISQRPVERPVRKREVEESKRYDSFGLFGNDFAIVSRMDNYHADDTHSVHMSVGAQRQYRPTDMDEEPLDRRAGDSGDERKDPLRRRKVDMIGSNDPKKPDTSGGTITPQLRQYYVNSFKYWFEKNDNFEISGLDALMASNALERQIYDKYQEKMKEYDDVCESICKVLRVLIPMKYLSTHIRNKGFKLTILIKLIDKDRTEVRKIDGFAKQKLEKNKGKPDEEIKVVDEEDELLENIGEENLVEETNLNFSDIESDGEAEEAVNQEVPVPPSKPNRPARALCYDPETGQYQIVKNKFASAQQQAEYTFYNMFKGGVFFETTDKPDPKKKPDRTKLFSCTGEEFIKYFTEIPDGLNLQPSLSKFEFEQYIQKVLMSDQAMNYLVLPLWVESATPLTIKNFYRTNECVGSVQYSSKCKLFIFPKEYIKPEWLNIINIYFVKKDMNLIELFGFIVLKLIDAESYEVKIIPEPVKVEKNHRAFKFIKNGNDTAERPMDIEILKVTKAAEDLDASAKDQNNYLDDLIDDAPADDDRNNPKRKPIRNKMGMLLGNELPPPGGSPPRGYRGNMGRDQGDFDSVAGDSMMPMRGGGNRGMQHSQMFSGMVGGRRGGDFESNDGDNKSKGSSGDEIEDQMLGKRQPMQMMHAGRMQPGNYGQQQSMYPPHASDYQGNNSGRGGNMRQQRGGGMNRGGFYGNDRGMDQQMDYERGGGMMNQPNKMIKRDFPQSSGMQRGGKSQYYGNNQGMGGYDQGRQDHMDNQQGYKQSSHPSQQSHGYQQRQGGYQGHNQGQMGGGMQRGGHQGQGHFNQHQGGGFDRMGGNKPGGNFRGGSRGGGHSNYGGRGNRGGYQGGGHQDRQEMGGYQGHQSHFNQGGYQGRGGGMKNMGNYGGHRQGGSDYHDNMNQKQSHYGGRGQGYQR